MFKCLLILLALIAFSSAHGSCDCSLDIKFKHYKCLCSGVTINEHQSDFADCAMHHERNFSDTNVTYISFRDSFISFNSPEILTKFPNAQSYHVEVAGLKTLMKFNECRRLRNIYLGSNKLATVGEGIFRKCSHLKILNMNSNLIEIVDSSAFVGLKNLISLSLSVNLITQIERKMFTPLVNLRKLRLNDNKIEFIHEGTFSDLTKLSELHLHRNQIRQIYPTALAGLSYLRHLHLDLNNLTNSIDDDIFKDLKNLELIGLDYNQINQPTHFLDYNEKLKTLSMKGNQISSFDPGFFRGLTSLQSLDLRDNICINKGFVFSDFELEVEPEIKPKCFKKQTKPPRNQRLN